MYRKGGRNMARQQRCGLLDTVRGLALTSMAAYHLAWDLVYVYHGSLPWFTGMPGYVWQQANLPMADYYSLLPWLFLFWGGYYACRTLPVLPPWFRRSLEPFAWAGRHSLLLYLLHQPVLYGLLALWFR